MCQGLLHQLDLGGAFFVQSDLPLKKRRVRTALKKRQIMFKTKPVLRDQVIMPNILYCDSDFIKKELSVCILTRENYTNIFQLRQLIAKSKIEDCFGHTILGGQYYLKWFYLRTIRSKTLSKLQFTMMKEHVYVMTDEVFETFIEMDENLQCQRKFIAI